MNHKYFIIVTGYNCQSFVKDCYLSILNQTYKNFDCIFITDGCTDNTVDEVIKLKNTDPRFEFFTCSENMGAAYRRWEAIKSLTKKTLTPESIICLIGMDDTLKNNALEIVSKHYDSGKWMTYGNWQTPTGVGLVNGFLNYKDSIHLSREYRKDVFRATAMNTFKKFLFDKLFEEDFKYKGLWIKATTESNLMFSCLEMCGKERIGVVEDAIYIYNKGRADNARNRFGSNYQDEIYKDVVSKPKKRLFQNKQIITVALPLYKSPIAWLALEGLCRQVCVCEWELIIYEDEKNPLGEEFFKPYRERLSKANCVRVAYMYSEKRIPLSYKWIDMAHNADKDSLGILLQAADCYSEPKRIQTAFEKLSQGYDWIHSKWGVFYNIKSKTTALFGIGNCNTGLNMTISKDVLSQIQKHELWSGVDNWLSRNLKRINPNAKIYLDISDNWRNGLDTDGYNKISTGREDLMKELKMPFYKSPIKASQCVPDDVFESIELFNNDVENKINSNFKILNVCTDDYANFAYDNAMAINEAGGICRAVKVKTHKFGYEKQADILMPQQIVKEIELHDIIQIFHSDTNFLLSSANKNKKIIVYHTGSNYRDNPDKYNNLFNEHIVKSFTDQCEFHNLGAKNLSYIASAIDVKNIDKFICNDKPIFAHYPSDPIVKGTDKIISMMSVFKNNINFIYSKEIVSHKQQYLRMNDCDIYIELFQPELNGKPYGCYGVTAFEAAALGKIVVTQNINKNVYYETYGNCPFIICNTENEFVNNIKKLLSMTKYEIIELKKKTYNWVKENHSYKPTGEYILKHIL